MLLYTRANGLILYNSAGASRLASIYRRVATDSFVILLRLLVNLRRNDSG